MTGVKIPLTASRRAVSAVTARVPRTTSLTLLSGMPSALASRYWDRPSGFRNSCKSTSPGCTLGKVSFFILKENLAYALDARPGCWLALHMESLALFPKTRADFDEMFASERACLAYLVRRRWPSGYRCVYCGSGRAWLNQRGSHHCSQCGRQFGATAGTLLHRTRFPLKTWLEVAWHVCEQKNGLSALGLQRAMGFGSYHTAWEWLHRMRRAMVLSSRCLSGEVEVGETCLGGVKPGKRGRGPSGKSLVLIAAEVRGPSIGRIRLRLIKDATADTLLDTVEELVVTGSNVVTDGLSSYAGLSAQGFDHTVSRAKPETGRIPLPKANRVALLLKRWILGTHQGSIGKDLLPYYLEEFVFRFNLRSSRSRGLLFSRLVEQALTHQPVPKKKIAGST